MLYSSLNDDILNTHYTIYILYTLNNSGEFKSRYKKVSAWV